MAALASLNLLQDTFEKQNNFIRDPSKRKAALCTRRSGKSYGLGKYLFQTAYENKRVKCLYIGLTRESAYNIMWEDVLKQISIEQGISIKTNEKRLTMRLNNNSIIRLMGADARPGEMEKALGEKYKLVVCDEAGSFRQDLRKLIYENLEPACVDLAGTVVMSGTPTDITKSLFYDVTNGKEKGWSVHKWSTFDNPFLAERWRDSIDEKIKLDPDIVNTPAFKRMYLGEWYVDFDKLVYKFNRLINIYRTLPIIKYPWYHVIGVDLGHDDESAFVVSCYHAHSPILYFVECHKEKKLDFYQVAAIIRSLMTKYNTSTVVIDGANKQGVEQMRKRHGLPLKRADKLGKIDHIDLMNADFRTSRILVHEGCTELMDEYANLIWDDRKLKKEEHASCANHLADAGLYNFIYAYSYCFTKEPEKIDMTTDNFMDKYLEEKSEKMKRERYEYV